jgi:hypothetical protein
MDWEALIDIARRDIDVNPGYGRRRAALRVHRRLV